MFDPKTVKYLKRVEECEAVHLSEAVVVDEIRSVSVDQSVEGKTVLPAVGEKRRVRGEVTLTHLLHYKSTLSAP